MSYPVTGLLSLALVTYLQSVAHAIWVRHIEPATIRSNQSHRKNTIANNLAAGLSYTCDWEHETQAPYLQITEWHVVTARQEWCITYRNRLWKTQRLDLSILLAWRIYDCIKTQVIFGSAFIAPMYLRKLHVSVGVQRLLLPVDFWWLWIFFVIAKFFENMKRVLFSPCWTNSFMAFFDRRRRTGTGAVTSEMYAATDA